MVSLPKTPARGRAAAALAVVLVLAYAASLAHGQAPQRRALLPDLQAAVPDHLVLAVHKARAFIGFDSAVLNTGEGPLEVQGSRSTRNHPGMTARQVIAQSDGTRDAERRVDALRYVEEPRHRYWHLDDVMGYELRSYPGFALVQTRTRRGYCLSDHATYPGSCGRGEPGLLSLTEGIGPARASRWFPMAEGQSFDVTNLPTGRYWLVTRADPRHLFAEADTSNDVSSVLIDFSSRQQGRTHRYTLTLVGSCPGAGRCANPRSFAK